MWIRIYFCVFSRGGVIKWVGIKITLDYRQKKIEKSRKMLYIIGAFDKKIDFQGRGGIKITLDYRPKKSKNARYFMRVWEKINFRGEGGGRAEGVIKWVGIKITLDYQPKKSKNARYYGRIGRRVWEKNRLAGGGESKSQLIIGQKSRKRSKNARYYRRGGGGVQVNGLGSKSHLIIGQKSRKKLKQISIL